MKYLEFSDFHFEPGELHDRLAQAIKKAADDHEVDFIAHSGDLFNRPIMASEKGGINQIRSIIKMLTVDYPLCAIYGTPSHEAPGSLDPLEDCGLTVLRPGKIYGYYGVDDRIKIINPDIGYMKPLSVLFGIPELNKKKTDNPEAGLRKYILDFVAPMRAHHPNIPAIGLFHVNLSDSKKENCTDIILKSSEILIHAEDLEPANLNRWSLGHIHKPWESEKISAGYPGSYGQTWGETGFKPGFNIVEIDEFAGEVKITREYYGTPERKKIYAPLESYDPEIAYWLESDDPNAVVPAGHPDSRVTYIETKEATKRAADINENMSLKDFAKIADPELDESILVLFDEIETEIKKPLKTIVDLTVDSVEVSGCVFFRQKTVRLDISSLPNSLTEIRGGNGSGKSSLMAFCSPYPYVVGKDTKSGKASAIKDWFPESGTITKKLTVNGKKHEHIVNVKKAKTECYLTIDGAHVLDKGTFDEMAEKCIELYGPFEDYFLTTFYAQPLQGKAGSSLMSASMTEIRNLVQSIAGINRESEKRFALDKVAELEELIRKDQSWLEASKEFQIDIEAEKVKKSEAEKALKQYESDLLTIESKGKQIAIELDSLKAKQALSEQERKQKSIDEQKKSELEYSISQKKEKIDSLNILVSKLELNKILLADKKANIEEITAQEKRRADHRQSVSDWKNKKQSYDMAIQKNESLKKQAELLSDPCPQCGYIRSQERIDEILKQIVEVQLFTDQEPDPFTEQLIEKLNIDESKVQDEINKALSAQETISILKSAIQEHRENKNALDQKTYNIDPDINSAVTKKQEEYNDTRAEYNTINQSKTGKEYEIKQIEKNIQQAIETQKKTDDCNTRILVQTGQRSRWNTVANLLNPNKIPAIEMELMTSAVDADATRTLESFLDGRFSFWTETQTEGAKRTVDRFDIKIHDNETGISKSFLEHSPGEKAFFADAYVKALIRKRNERMQRSYSPIISDEADGPIEPSRIPAYYDIQRRYFSERKVLVISHNPASHEHIENQINIKELIE